MASAHGDGLKTQSAGEVSASAKVGYQGQAKRPTQESQRVPSLVRINSASTGNLPPRGPVYVIVPEITRVTESHRSVGYQSGHSQVLVTSVPTKKPFV